jgi:hypothetical protein
MLREQQDEIASKLEKNISGETNALLNTDLIEDKEYDAEVNSNFDVTVEIDPDYIDQNLEVNNKINGLSLNAEVEEESDSEHPGKEQVL